MNAKPQIIEQDGKPAFVVLPIEEWERILDRIEDLEDEAAIRNFHEQGERTYPSDVVYAILDGANPVKVYREWRGLTQAELAKAAGIAKLYLSQIETGRRSGSAKVLRRWPRRLTSISSC